MLDTKRREFIALLGAGGLLLAVKVRRARGRQPTTPVIGYLSVRSPGESASVEAAFRKGLSKAGYVEGQNCTSRFAGLRVGIDSRRWQPIWSAATSQSSRH
jgi:hypothetical protein